jgi:hypothetical protein
MRVWKTTKTKVPIKAEVIPVTVKPAEVAALKQDVSDKQKVIDKLQTDLTAQQQVTTDLEVRLNAVEVIIIP